jgi:hypothetical protein
MDAISAYDHEFIGWRRQMFSEYVTGPYGEVDLDRARLLMDQRLAREAIAFVEGNWGWLHYYGTFSKAQAFFDNYRLLHSERYGTEFPPLDDLCLRSGAVRPDRKRSED